MNYFTSFALNYLFPQLEYKMFFFPLSFRKTERRSTYECVRCLKAFMNNKVIIVQGKTVE